MASQFHTTSRTDAQNEATASRFPWAPADIGRIEGMSRRASRYRVRAVCPGSYDEISAYSRRADALKRARVMVSTWDTAEAVMVHDIYTGEDIFLHVRDAARAEPVANTTATMEVSPPLDDEQIQSHALEHDRLNRQSIGHERQSQLIEEVARSPASGPLGLMSKARMILEITGYDQALGGGFSKLSDADKLVWSLCLDVLWGGTEVLPNAHRLAAGQPINFRSHS